MVDRAARDAYAQVLRHFAAGVITNDEYDDRSSEILQGSSDPALQRICAAVGFCYDDMGTDRLRGKDKLSTETRRIIARAILFLYSDREYSWPKDVLGNIVANILGTLQIALMLGSPLIFWLAPGLLQIWGALMLGVLVLIIGRDWDRKAREVLDIEFWPFTSPAEEEDERRRPRLLAGRY